MGISWIQAAPEASAPAPIAPPPRRRSDARETIHYSVERWSLGAILIAGTDRGLCAVLLGDEEESLERSLRAQFPEATLQGDDPEWARVVGWVSNLLEQPGATVYLPLDPRGTAFQQRVWQALREIPAGATTTYGDIARQIGSPRSARAVARACAANPLAVVIPCHRVVRGNGDLSGYRWGIERKRALLAREARG